MALATPRWPSSRCTKVRTPRTVARGHVAPDPTRATLLASRRLLDDVADRWRARCRPHGARNLADLIASAHDETIEARAVRLDHATNLAQCAASRSARSPLASLTVCAPARCRPHTRHSTSSASSQACRSRCAISRAGPSLRARVASRCARPHAVPRLAALTSHAPPAQDDSNVCRHDRHDRLRCGHAAVPARRARPRAGAAQNGRARILRDRALISTGHLVYGARERR